jgi:hypothetical protein
LFGFWSWRLNPELWAWKSMCFTTEHHPSLPCLFFTCVSYTLLAIQPVSQILLEKLSKLYIVVSVQICEF